MAPAGNDASREPEPVTPSLEAAGPLPVPASLAQAHRGEDARPAWLDRGRIPTLDGLRAISILLVLVEHATINWGFLGSGFLHLAFGNVGVMGVDMFFAISGFLITLLLVREMQKTGTISLKGFYIRRFLRLMPAAIVFLLAIFALQWMGRVHMDGRNWLHVLTYTANFDPQPAWETGHLWSLSIEEQFYLAWPVTLLLLGERRARALAIAWLMVTPLFRFAVLTGHPYDWGRFENWTPFRVDCIAAGCLLALMADDSRFRRLTRVSRPVAMALIAVSGIILVLSYLLGFPITAYEVTIGHTVRAAAIVALIWLSANHFGSAWGRLLETRPFVILGLLSYSLYLWQQPFFAPHATASGHGVGFSLTFAMLAAAASYLLVEQPFLQLKDRLDKRRRPVEEEKHA